MKLNSLIRSNSLSNSLSITDPELSDSALWALRSWYLASAIEDIMRYRDYKDLELLCC